MEFRKIFNTIPEKFDKWRSNYCDEVFQCIIAKTNINSDKNVLEIGPGTGQATEPILKTGCNYSGIELGEDLAKFTCEKFSKYSNCNIINGDFETYIFQEEAYDLVYSAATIQWIPEETAFSKTYKLLKRGGALAMMTMYGNYKSANEELYVEIQNIYSEHFHPEIPYTQKIEYDNVIKYGFSKCEKYEFNSRREFTASNYVEYLGTHCDHIVLREPEKSLLYDGVRNAILKYGNKIEFNDTITLYIARKD